jgi:N-methylhydantoinase A
VTINEAKPNLRAGIDVGGTFTDIQIFEEATGRLWEFKTPTTPTDPSIGLFAGLRAAADSFGFQLSDIHVLMHGTTIATNAVLEHKLPLGALVTTSGFEDVFEIGRHDRKHIYSLKPDARYMLVPRKSLFGVRERVASSGTMVEPLDEAEARDVAVNIKKADVKSVAVCLLNAFANPANERRLRDILEEALPDLPISISSEVNPEIREYERTSTTVLNALLIPIVRGYLRRLEQSLQREGLNPHVYLLQSNGGVAGLSKAAILPARLLLSGPCGGALAAEKLSNDTGEPNLVAVDMGGTSFDVSIIQDGRSAMVTEAQIEGCPIRLPMVEIRTIGAGGGSIAWLDKGGRLLVGPQSAGAEPGPACYGRGGNEPTVTDANLALGRIEPNRFLAGEMELNLERAQAAIRSHIAGPLGMSVEQAAEGIIDITVAKLATAVRLSLFEKGLDPADFALFVFGGAGGLHGAQVAQELGLPRTIFPRAASTLSAYGTLWSDITHDISRTVLRPMREDMTSDIQSAVNEMVAEGSRLLDQDEVLGADRSFTLSADMRYKGQGFEVSVPWTDLNLTPNVLATAMESFHLMHMQRFSHNNPNEPVELVTLRLMARGNLSKPRLQPVVPKGESGLFGSRPVYFDGAWHETPIHDRATLRQGRSLLGPAIVLEDYSTIWVPPNWSLDAMMAGDLVGSHRKGSQP